MNPPLNLEKMRKVDLEVAADYAKACNLDMAIHALSAMEEQYSFGLWVAQGEKDEKTARAITEQRDNGIDYIEEVLMTDCACTFGAGAVKIGERSREGTMTEGGPSGAYARGEPSGDPTLRPAKEILPKLVEQGAPGYGQHARSLLESSLACDFKQAMAHYPTIATLQKDALQASLARVPRDLASRQFERGLSRVKDPEVWRALDWTMTEAKNLLRGCNCTSAPTQVGYDTTKR